MKSRSDSYYSLHVIGLSVGGVDYSSKAPTEAIISSATTYFYLN